MAWNPTPEVAAARDFAAKFGCDRVIILFTTPAQKMGFASYGATTALCDETKTLADRAYDAVFQEFHRKARGANPGLFDQP